MDLCQAFSVTLENYAISETRINLPRTWLASNAIGRIGKSCVLGSSVKEHGLET